MKQFTESLSEVLRGPLPGIEAQKRMMPRAETLFDRFSIEVKKGAKEGAVLLLLYPKDGDIFFPLTLRQTYNGAHSGQISFPGGKIEPTDDSPTDTALRETQEELGINRSSIQILGKLTDLFIMASNFNVRPVVGYVSEVPDFKIDNREVAEVIEISIGQLLDTRLVKEKEMKVNNKYPIQAPYFDFGGYHVWGATAMMLSEFKELIKGKGIAAF